MELTIKNPAVMDPSHMPRMRRTANKPAKFLQAAWQQRATAQIDILRLVNVELREKCSENGSNLIHLPTGNRCRHKF
jgi:hypothetical protein